MFTPLNFFKEIGVPEMLQVIFLIFFQQFYV